MRDPGDDEFWERNSRRPPNHWSLSNWISPVDTSGAINQSSYSHSAPRIDRRCQSSRDDNMIAYDVYGSSRHYGGGYRKLRSQSSLEFMPDGEDEEQGGSGQRRRSRSPEVKDKTNNGGGVAQHSRGICSGRIWCVLTLLVVVTCVYMLVQSRSFQRILHPAAVRQPPKLILIWDRNSRFLDVKPYREKKAIPRKGLQNAFAGCTCEVTSDAGAWRLADAIVINAFYLRRINDFTHFFPHRRTPSQLWVFHMLEPAQILTENRDKGFFDRLNGQFNLTMTYRLDSDVLATYGQIRRFYVDDQDHPGAKALAEAAAVPVFRDYAQDKKYLVAWFASNCGAKSGRMDYVRELQKHLPVDIYGDCGPLKCPNATYGDCGKMLNQNYKFYLSFESSVCQDYITEKFFNPLQQNVVPVVLGGGNYSAINAPANSYIDVRDYATVQDLADYLLYLDATPSAYNEYFDWKREWKVERSGVYTRNLCDLCGKLNEIAAPNAPYFHQIYPDMTKWWHGDAHCRRGRVVNGSWVS
ncbi:putative Alpha-(1,3)-fucosyltransferase C [Hypsibius exemplaris]|uniref:Fucosyltransferase n=1 Tax=Hypsibius exemplaris TaxID=2072580 RepID=A0A1W0WUM0_HYPEX|nr:putative Alpha-(1,3)-fucosyltransferase C [Hypsibius exemplaris]